MKQAVALVQSYVPPDPQRIQAVKTAGNLAMSPTGPDSVRLDLRNYVKSGDTLSLGLDTARNALQTVEREVLPRIREGRGHAGRDLRPAPRRALLPGQRRAQRARARRSRWWSRTPNYQRVAPARRRRQAGGRPSPRPPPRPAKPGASTAALDNLTGPIALYPDALVAQILEASKDVAAVQKFAGWLKSNARPQGHRPPGRRAEGRVRGLLHRAGAVPPGGPDDGREAGLDQAARRGLHERPSTPSTSPSSACARRRWPSAT